MEFNKKTGKYNKKESENRDLYWFVEATRLNYINLPAVTTIAKYYK